MSITTSIQTLFPSAQGETALAKGIPMSMLEMTRIAYKDAGIKIRVVYRGPRAQSVGRIMPGSNGYPSYSYKRSRNSAQSTCMKCDATSFAIYPL